MSGESVDLEAQASFHSKKPDAGTRRADLRVVTGEKPGGVGGNRDTQPGQQPKLTVVGKTPVEAGRGGQEMNATAGKTGRSGEVFSLVGRGADATQAGLPKAVSGLRAEQSGAVRQLRPDAAAPARRPVRRAA